MSLSLGKEVYNADRGQVVARGIEIDSTLLHGKLKEVVQALIDDVSGQEDIEQILAGLADTGFKKEALESILTNSTVAPAWRIGEAIAEAFTSMEHNCKFPWPSGRDLKNPKASPAGVDLVGFQQINSDGTATYRLAFGEVKTSKDKKESAKCFAFSRRPARPN